MSVRLERVAGRADRSRFLALPRRLYAQDPLWVPPLSSSVRKLLDPARHPFYGHGRGAEMELFLAREGSEVVGRVAAILNRAHNAFHDEKVAFFGFFESVPRAEVATCLLAGVEEWARERGLDAVRGPANPSTNYECGLLVEGFGRPPVLMMTYNPPFYRELIEGAGYHKAKDLLAFISPVHDRSLERLERLAERTRRRNPGLRTRAANLKDFSGEVNLVQEVYNAAWEDNWGFVPMSDGEIEALARELQPLVHPGLLRFALDGDEPIAFLLAVPDWNPVLRDLGGSPWRHPVRTLRHWFFTGPEDLEGLRLITLGVKAEHRLRGVEGVLFAESLREGLRLGYEWCEYSWILEDNELTKRSVRLMDGELYKTYRIYEKPL